MTKNNKISPCRNAISSGFPNQIYWYRRFLVVVLFGTSSLSSNVVAFGSHISTGWTNNDRYAIKSDSDQQIRLLSNCDSEHPTEILDQNDIETLDRMVKRRSNARWDGDYAQADELRDEIMSFHLPPGYGIWIEDIPRKEGGGTKWKLIRERNECDLPMQGPTILDLARAALGVAVSSSARAQTTAPE